MTALFAAIILLATATFATENPDPSLPVREQFNLMFAKSTDVQWEQVSGFHKVTFVQAGKYLSAYYNNLGEFESVSRNITTNMLPLMLQNALQKKLSGAWVSESFEVSGNGGTRYYVAVENAFEKVIYYSGTTEWSLYKRTQK